MSLSALKCSHNSFTSSGALTRRIEVPSRRSPNDLASMADTSDKSLTNSKDNKEQTNDTPDPELLIKHPLQNSWTLWFYKNDRSRNWEENQRKIITFCSVEDFWALYNHIEPSSKLLSGCDYSLFKEGIKPMWEDAKNNRGGRWLINLDKKQRINCLDNFWLEVMLCLIGETFGDGSQYVNGAVVQVRGKGDKIGIWMGDSTKGDCILAVGKRVKETLGIDSKTPLGFEAHHDSMKKSGSTAKNRFIV